MITLLNVETECRNHKTILIKSFATAPLKIANITENKQQALLELMLMSSSPGILSGDEYKMQISVATDCLLRLHTQSFQRLFNMPHGLHSAGAIQKVEVDVQENALFCFVPHPTVPHKNAVFSNFNIIKLQPSSTLIWGEIISCGRKLNGEAFQFTRLRIKTEIFIADKLVIKENLLAEPATKHPSTMGQWEGYSHQASLIIVDNTLDIKVIIEMILAILQQQDEIEFGLSEPNVNGLVIRLLGYKGEQLYKCLQQIAGLVTAIIEKKKQPHVA